MSKLNMAVFRIKVNAAKLNMYRVECVEIVKVKVELSEVEYVEWSMSSGIAKVEWSQVPRNSSRVYEIEGCPCPGKSSWSRTSLPPAFNVLVTFLN
jgi:hypothetical protein